MRIPAVPAFCLLAPRLVLLALFAPLLATPAFAQSSPVQEREIELRDLVTPGADASAALALGERGIRLLDLGTLGGDASAAWAIDAEGQVVGWSLLANGERRAFTTCATCTMQELGTLGGGSDSIARAVSGTGQWIAGSSGINAYGPNFREFTQGFVYSGGSMTSVGALFCPCSFNERHGTSEAYGVNDGGAVVGSAPSPRANYYHGFIWKNGVIEDISESGPGDPSYSRAYDINNAGQIVGYIDRDDSRSFTEGDRNAFIWEDGAFRTLDHLPGYTSSTAVAINEAGKAVGWSGDVSGADSSAAMWSGGSAIEIGSLRGDSNSRALAVNDEGQVVGWSGNGENASRAFFWQAGFMLDLNSLLPADSGWHLVEARGINNDGMIVGSAMVDGEMRAFLITPPSMKRLLNAVKKEVLPNLGRKRQ